MRQSAKEKKVRLQRSAGWLTVGLFLVLGALVVLWGTEYKLSLYKAEPTMQTPAKLCTRSSDTARSQVHLAIRPAETAAPLPDTITVSVDADRHGAEAVALATPVDVSLPSSPREAPQVAFRPPPSVSGCVAA
jgi:hypothetical protein